MKSNTPHIGLEIEQARDYILTRYREFVNRKGEPEFHPDTGEMSKYLRGYNFAYYPRHEFEGHVRDAGWCIGHKYQNKGLHDVHDAVVDSLSDEDEAYEVSRIINTAFHGICDWMC